MDTNMNLPIRALYTIREFSKPVWTRPDWRFCGYREASLMMRYHEWERRLYYDMDWFTLNMDGKDAIKWIHETKMIQHIIRFEQDMPRHMIRDEEILIRWMYLYWPEGLDGFVCDL